MTADKEHVECLALKQAREIGYLIHNRRQSHAHGKHRHCAENTLVTQLNVTRIKQIRADAYHRAVADHGLNIDAYSTDEHVPGVDHNAHTREKRVGSKIGAKGVVYSSLLDNTR